MEDRNLISVKNLKKYFPRNKDIVHAVEDVSFNIRKGETFGLVGESGSGKSTVARLIIRLIDPDEGNIIFDGVDITGLSEKEYKAIQETYTDRIPGPGIFTESPDDCWDDNKRTISYP